MKLTTTSTSLAIVLINRHSYIWKVFGSIVPADASTTEHPGLALGCTFNYKKLSAQTS
jgi:hypothetical protein